MSKILLTATINKKKNTIPLPSYNQKVGECDPGPDKVAKVPMDLI